MCKLDRRKLDWFASEYYLVNQEANSGGQMPQNKQSLLASFQRCVKSSDVFTNHETAQPQCLC
jgi:hypothetical protein